MIVRSPYTLKIILPRLDSDFGGVVGCTIGWLYAIGCLVISIVVANFAMVGAKIGP